ncbi:MAG: hypothetical protein ACK5Z4_11170, partial [Planctomyces sp.]
SWPRPAARGTLIVAGSGFGGQVTPIQPFNMCYNPINGIVYPANRLTLNIGVITTGASAVDVDGNGVIDIDNFYRLNQ